MVAVAHRSLVTAWIVGALIARSRPGRRAGAGSGRRRRTTPCCRRSSPRRSRATPSCTPRSRPSTPRAPAPDAAPRAARSDGLDDLHQRRLGAEPRQHADDDAWVHGEPDAALLGQAPAARRSGRERGAPGRAAAGPRAARRSRPPSRAPTTACCRRASCSRSPTEQRALWSEIEVVARARYAVGQGAQQDVLRVQVEVTRIEQRAIEQAAEAELRVAELNRLLARPIDTPVATSARLALQPLTGTVAGRDRTRPRGQPGARVGAPRRADRAGGPRRSRSASSSPTSRSRAAT